MKLGIREARSRLLAAAKIGDIPTIQEVLEQESSAVDRRNSHGNTPLRTAVAHGQTDTAKYLVAAGADPHQSNHGGSSLVEAAAMGGYRALVEWLASEGLKVSIVEWSAIDALDRVTAFVEADPGSLNARDRRGQTPAHAAARTGAVDVLMYLLTEGAAVNAEDRHGHTPLATAVEVSEVDAAECLLLSSAAPNARGGHFGGTVLHRAVIHKSAEMVNLLLQFGSDPNRQDAAGKTVLHEAISSSNVAMVELILSTSQVDLHIRTPRSSRGVGSETPYDMAVRKGKKRMAELIQQRM